MERISDIKDHAGNRGPSGRALRSETGLSLFDTISEISLICGRIDDSMPSAWISKRIQFMGYDIRATIAGDLSPRERLNSLNSYFFGAKDFQAISDSAYTNDAGPLYLLARVLASRVGSPMMIALLYAYLAEQIGVNLHFVDLQPHCFLKLVDAGTSSFIDLSKAGRCLSSEELLELVQTRWKSNVSDERLAETLSHEHFVVDFCHALKRTYAKREDAERLLILLNHILEYQPSNLLLVAERAMVLRKLGRFKSALLDLKRYFAFHDRETAPPEFVQLYDDLNTLFQDRKNQIDILE
jgi:regulator of sirC expression with transglutaminase-like and TPR domain